MDGRIYDLLKKIDEFKIEKFGLSKENRILLKKMLINEDFLNEFIKKVGNDGVVNFLNNIYNSLKFIGDSIINIKVNSESSEEIKDIINSTFGDDLEKIEQDREDVLNSFVKKEKDHAELLKKMEDEKTLDGKKYEEILNKLKE